VRVHRYLEGAATGVAYASALAALSAFAVASFRPNNLSMPYWASIGWLRTDTFGFTCFVVATLSFIQAEFLRLTRGAVHRSATANPEPRPHIVLVVAVARAFVAASSVLVIYLSVNAVTHPHTLLLPATHRLSWPSEGTLRVVALIVTACSAAVARAQRIAIGRPS
jgi:uncharacterized membrane protein